MPTRVGMQPPLQEKLISRQECSPCFIRDHLCSYPLPLINISFIVSAPKSELVGQEEVGLIAARYILVNQEEPDWCISCFWFNFCRQCNDLGRPTGNPNDWTGL